MSVFSYRKEQDRIVLTADGTEVAYLRTLPGAEDTLTEI